MITGTAPDMYYEFDITAVSDQSQRVQTLMVFINYSATAFGSNIHGTPALTATLPEPDFSSNYELIANNTDDNILALTMDLNDTRVYLSTVRTIFHIKMKIIDSTANVGISFNPNVPNGLMSENSWYYINTNYIQYNPVITGTGLDETLPVELSSFTASINAQNNVSLNWITQSETGVIGFNIYRAPLDDLESAELVSPLITATNTSTTQSYVYVDKDLYEPGEYYYWLQNVDLDGSMAFHGPISITYTGNDSNHSPNIGPVDGINQTYPNPFNPNVFIGYGLTKAAKVDLAVYNLRGQLVSRLVDAPRESGSYRVIWNGIHDSGSACSSGVYIVRMTAGGKTWSSRIMLVK